MTILELELLYHSNRLSFILEILPLKVGTFGFSRSTRFWFYSNNEGNDVFRQCLRIFVVTTPCLLRVIPTLSPTSFIVVAFVWLTGLQQSNASLREKF